MTVTWEFTVESLTSVNFMGINEKPPLVVGTLSVSDEIWLSGGLEFSYQNQEYTFQNTGPTDGWTFNLGTDLVLPNNLGSYAEGWIYLLFNQTGDLNGTIIQYGHTSTLRMDITDNAASGFAASDSSVFGCADAGSCDYTGSWLLISDLLTQSNQPLVNVSVPEPGIFLLLVLSLLVTSLVSRKLGSN